MDHSIVKRANALLEFRADLLKLYPGLQPNPMGGVAKITVTTPVVVTESGTQSGITHTFEVTQDAMQSFFNWMVAAYDEAGALLTSVGITYP